MSSIEKRTTTGQARWYARYRDPSGKQRTKSFARKVDAERYLAGIETAKLSGSYIDPRRAAVTVGAFAEQWQAAQAHLKASTRDRYAGLLRTHVEPRWASVRLSDVNHAAVQAWVSELADQHSPSVAIKAHRVLSLVLALAVRDGRLVRNPAEGIGLPRETPKDRRYLTHQQVHALAEAAGDHGLVIVFLAYTGLRFGEMAALRVSRLDLLRRQVEVVESVTAVKGALVWGTPKGHSRRWVGIPRFVAEALAQHIDGKSPNELVFTTDAGAVLRASNFRRDVWDHAVKAADLDGVVPHGLRHTAASLAIAAGADVKVVQQMLGHKSATMTLDLYGHLFENRLDEVADRLDSAARASTDVYRLCTQAEIVDLDQRRRDARGP
ncbi:MAG: xerD [Pseudonocardiales bacterium]|nr:xerD [Pseudonocardiales bacterium]